MGFHYRVADYFVRLKMRNGGRGPLKERRKPSVSDCDGFKILPFRQAFLKATKYAKDVYQLWKYIAIRFKSSISCCFRNTVQNDSL